MIRHLVAAASLGLAFLCISATANPRPEPESIVRQPPPAPHVDIAK